MYRVRIKTLPNKKDLPKAVFGKQVDGALQLKPSSFGGADWRESKGSSYGGVRGSISADPREDSNLEAEGGETAFGNISGQSIPDHLKIKGNRHSKGGVPLNLPDDTFIFSDTSSMKITDPAILAMFNKNPKKGGYTPAELAKPYDIQKYKGILLDPESGPLERKTAELMIKNMIMKLGALALSQEAKKGFPQGIPAVAKPYMEANGIAEEDLMPELKEQAEQMAMQQQQAMPNPEMQAQEQAMMPDQTMDQDQAMYAQGQQQFPQQMPSGAPVAMPQNMQPGMGQEQMMPPQGPMAMYGMEMGGYGMPFYDNPNEMAYGGVPRLVNGGPGDRPGSTRQVSPEEYASKNWEIARDSQGEYKINRTTGEIIGRAAAQTRQQREAQGRSGSGGSYTKEDVCRWVSDPNNKNYFGWSGQQAFTAGLISRENIAFIDNCSAELERETLSEEAIATTSNPTTIPGQETEILNTKKCKCVDPDTLVEKIFDIAEDEECVCEELIQGQGQGIPPQQPHWSKNSQMNVLNQAMMRTNLAPNNTILPGRAQVQRPYEEYQTKVDQGLAGIANMQNAIMYGMSGSTGMKQAAMKDALGVGLRSSMNAVADVQARNTAGQAQGNAQNAQIDNANMMARNAIGNQSLKSSEEKQNLRTGLLNKRDYNVTRSVMDANEQMANLQKVQQTTPQFGAEYDYGMIYNTGVPKSTNPIGGGAARDERVRIHMSNGASYEKAYDLAMREERLAKGMYGGNFADGGFLYGDVTFPFLM